VYNKTLTLHRNIDREPLKSGNAAAELVAAKLKAINKDLRDA